MIKTHLKNVLLEKFLTERRSSSDVTAKLSRLLINELNSSDPDNHTILEIKAQLHQLTAQKMTAAFKKVKSINIQNRERPTKFFFRKLHSRRMKNAIPGLIDPSGSGDVLEGDQQIIDALTSHYTQRFDSRVSSGALDIQSLLEKGATVRGCAQEGTGLASHGSLDIKVSEKEISDSIGGHHGSSSSGPDGLNSTFYKNFTRQLVPFLAALCNYVASFSYNAPLSLFSANANLTPIPKKGRKKSHIISIGLRVDDFRIVSTINFDLRVLARIINNRIGTLVGGTLHPYIFGVRGRNINHSVLLQFSATNNIKQPKGTQPQIIKADLSNAFDFTSVLHLLSHFFRIFGRTLTSDLLVFLLLNRRLQIKLSRRCSRVFGMVNGLLQGCPLSSTLFSIYMEPLMITLDRGIRGLTIPGSLAVVRSLSYIDDLVVGCRDAYDVKSVFRILREFQDATGSAVNMEKTFSVHLMLPSTKYDRSYLSRNSAAVLSQKILGHYLLPSQKHLRSAQKRAFIDEASSFFKAHRCRGLSLMGKVQVVNSMVISKFSYHCVFLLFTRSWFSDFYTQVRGFLWSKTSHVSMAKLFLPKAYGGLGLINLRLYFVLRRFRFSFSIPNAFQTKSGLAMILQKDYNLRFKLSDALRVSLAQLLGCDIVSTFSLGYGASLRSMCNTHQYQKLPINYLTNIPCLFLPPGALNFLFMIQHGSLPVAFHLHYFRHMSRIPINCQFCVGGTETLSHLFSDCQSVWSIISGHLGNSGISKDTWSRILFTCQWHKREIKKIKIVITMAFAIWKVRCQMVFNQGVIYGEAIIREYNNIFTRDRLNLRQSDFNLIW